MKKIFLLLFAMVISGLMAKSYSQNLIATNSSYRIENTKYDKHLLSNTEWRFLNYKLYEKSPDKNTLNQVVLRFSNDTGSINYCLDYSEDFLVDNGKIFSFNPNDKIEASPLSFSIHYDFSLSSYALNEEQKCTLLALNYQNKNRTSFKEELFIVASLSDTLMVLCPFESAVRIGNDYYSFNPSVYINSKYLSDTNITRNYASFQIEEVWESGMRLESSCDADTLNFNIQEWISNNIKMPEDYSGRIDEGCATFKILFDKKGMVREIRFITKLDDELNQYISNKMILMPSVGILNDNNGFLDTPYLKFLTKQSFSTCFKRR